MSNIEKRISIKSKIDEIQNAIKNSPKNPELHNALGILFEKANRYDLAIESYKNAIRCDKGFIKAYNNIGVILYKQKRYNEAVEIFKLSLQEDDKFVSTYVNLGAAYNRAKRFDEGIEILKKAIKLDPKNSGAYGNLGNIYNKIDRYKDALKAHKKALKLDNKSASNHANIAITYKNLEDYKKAISEFKKAIDIDPEFANAHFDLATTYLVTGDFKEGFREYEWRFKKDEMKSLLRDHRYIFEKPKFELSFKTDDKTLLLYSEQGFGDMIQFIRFAEILKERFPTLKLKVQCRVQLKSLFQSLYFIDEVVSRDEDVGEFDYHYAIMSLPYLLEMDKKDIPTDPYISAKDDFGLNPDINKCNIGLVWGGSITGESYPKKIFSPLDMKPLMDCDDVRLYSLQVGEDAKMLEKLNISDDEIVDLSSKLTDFYKTASAIGELDLVITSDTSVAHLAGAMGKEVWVLLLKRADWRWELESDKTFWYPSMTLFRQEIDGVWDGVFDRVFKKLQNRYAIRLKKETA